MLADFSAALFVDDARNIGRIGSEIVTEPYRAPELVIHPDHRVKLSIDIDMRAWGLTVFDCVAFNPKGEPMFQALLGVGPKVTHSRWYVVRKACLQTSEVVDCLREFVAHSTNTADGRPSSVAQAAVALHR